MPTEILYEERDHVGVVTLNRPEARNASPTTYAELTDAVRSTAPAASSSPAPTPCRSSDDVKQVMAGAGERVSSGLRAEPWLTPPPTRPAHRRPGHRRSERRRGRLGHGAGPAGRHPHAPERARFGELFVKRAVLRRRGTRSSRRRHRPRTGRRCCSPAGSSAPTRPPAWGPCRACRTRTCCPPLGLATEIAESPARRPDQSACAAH